jgi:hypothetical protein
MNNSNRNLILGLLTLIGLSFLLSNNRKSKPNKPKTPSNPRNLNKFDFKVKSKQELENDRSDAYNYLA